MGIELSNIRKFKVRKRVVMCYPGVDNDFIEDRLQVAHEFEGIALLIGMEYLKSEILLKKYRELLVRAREIGKNVCVNGILLGLSENEKWCSRAIGVNKRVHMLYESMNCTYLDV